MNIKNINKNRKIYVVCPDNNTEHWQKYANWLTGYIVNDIKNANIVLFCGGEDVHPSVYGEDSHPTTQFNYSRDEYEIKIYKKAQKLNIPCVGICRGSQLLTALQPGGKLIQHQNNPFYTHLIDTFDNKSITVTSSHHQAMYPFEINKKDYFILGWTKNISSYHQGAKEKELNPPVECEIVYYPKTKCLCIQSHPEWQFEKDSKEDKNAIDYFQKLLTTFLNICTLEINLKDNCLKLEGEIDDVQPFPLFVKNLILEYNVKYNTLYLDGFIQTEKNKHRSFKDLYLICKYYYSDITWYDLFDVLINLLNEDVIYSLYCGNIDANVFFPKEDRGHCNFYNRETSVYDDGNKESKNTNISFNQLFSIYSFIKQIKQNEQ